VVVLNQRDRGMVTAELAVSLLSLLLVTAVLLWAVGVAGLRLRCSEAARAGARAAARGDSAAEIERAARLVLPGAVVRVTSGAGELSVEVAVSAAPPVPAVHLGGIVIRATSVAVAENVGGLAPDAPR
jgi:hypothetical protein